MESTLGNTDIVEQIHENIKEKINVIFESIKGSDDKIFINEKFTEIISYIFRDGFKSRKTCEIDGIEYEEEIHKLSNDKIDKKIFHFIKANISAGLK